MKFFSSATTAALAGLLLLVPAANGEQYFKCDSGKEFTMAEVVSYGKSATAELSRTIEPSVDDYLTRISYQFEIDYMIGGKYWYLVQICQSQGTYYFYELGGSYWNQCAPKMRY
ncbi:putative candidate secreted effector protein [Blumeria hordei DH14]|uniref:Putative candidate secreted effector protein n=1 Tax=Blumeria graminis f. sp. hordei (strain DH14) TaxID=546991 RepID=N1JK30_BLUG1|nr:putative candidate secreted effector protein [Blumeria hordei DH14]